MSRHLRQRVDSAKVIEVIEVQYPYGDGTEAEPVRIVTQYRSKDGELLAVCDQIRDNRDAYTKGGAFEGVK